VNIEAKKLISALGLAAVLAPSAVSQNTIKWKGYSWSVKQGSGLGPGPNTWNPANVFIDSSGFLHLRITPSGAGWTCAEVDTTDPLGFGTYQWQVEGPVDTLDPNVVLGLFGYKGPDGVNEIDVEFAHWGNPRANNGNWTVYPSSGTTIGQLTFPFKLDGTYTTSRYTWTSTGIGYWLMGGHQPIDVTRNVIKTWNYTPGNPTKNIPQGPMPLCMNLWLFQGHAPTNGRPVEIIIHDFVRKG
jgi:hypothetical protein